MKNEYEIRGDITAIFINSPKYGRRETLINTIKLDFVNEFPNTWNITSSIDKKKNYVYGKHKDKRIALHRLLTTACTSMDIDHIDGDTLNNTNENLRQVTHAENMQNRKGANSNNKSGIRNVYWNELNKNWRVYLWLETGKRQNVGSFKDIKDAEIAAIKARKEYMPFSQEALA